MAKVSVLLPVYNAALTLSRSVESILKQTLSELELIVIDNGSTDGCFDLINGYNDSRIKYFRLEKNDLVNALNFGLSKCSAHYVARMDADDYAYPIRLESQCSFLDGHREMDLVSGIVKYKGNKATNVGYSAYVDWVNTIKSSKDLYLSRFQESSLPHPSVMFRKKLISIYGGYKKNIPEDFELWNRWFQSGVRMGKVDDLILDWHDQADRLSRVNKNYDQDSFAKVKSAYFKQWYDKKFMNSIKPQLYVFGYSRIIRQKTAFLQANGLEISSFLDVQETASPNTILYKEIEKAENPFVLSYVSDRNGKVKIKKYLQSIGMIEGVNFLMME